MAEYATDPQVGDGVSWAGWSDTHAGTVIKRTPKSVTVQEDSATLLNRDELSVSPGGFCAHVEGRQVYAYERNPDGITRRFTLRSNGRFHPDGWATGQPGALTVGRHKHYDFNF